MSAAPLDAENYARIEAHLDAALDLPPDEREAYVDALVLPDELKSLLRHLLAADAGAHPLDSEPRALADAVGRGVDETPGAVVGGYRLVELIGEGGMATVWRAQRDDGGIARTVAVKCLRSGFATPRLRERFLREQRILARLEHPYIARLYDAGVSASGVPFIAMELVDGEPISRYAETHDLDLRARLRLFRRVIEAVAYAHAKLVVHRDLKPANILVGKDGLPRLLDFGIAKPLDEESAATQTQFRALTPEYAAPEQFSGHDAGTATDVYGLGATLYELLSRRRPRRARRDMLALATPGSTVAATTAPSDAVQEVDVDAAPDAPSSRLSPAQRQRLGTQLRGDLDRIVLTAMHHEPERRYRSAVELDDDIARWLDGLPLRAQPDSLAYRTRKFIRRHALALGIAAVVAAAVVAVAAVAINRAVEAHTQAARAAAVQEFLFGIFEAAQTDTRGNAVLTTREMVDNAAARLDSELFGADGGAAPEMKLAVGRVYRKLGQVDRAIALLRDAVSAQERSSRDTRALAIARHSYGMALADGLRFVDAERELRGALAWYEHHDTDPVARADVLDGLFSAVYYQARYDEAAALTAQALRLLEQAPDAVHARIVAQLNHAVAMRGLARFDDAIASAQQAVRLARSQPGHVQDQARALSTLGTLQRRSGDCEAAVTSLREAVTLGISNDREGGASRLHNLARALICTRDYAGARQAADDALSLQSLALGPEHPEIGHYRETLGLTLQGLGDLDGAERELRAALTAYLRGYPPASLNVRRKQQALAQLLVQRGHYQEAESLLDTSLQGATGEQPPDIEVRCVGELGLTRLALARRDRHGAERHLARALAEAARHARLERDTRIDLERAQRDVAALTAAR